MAFRTSRLPEKQLLPAHFTGTRFLGIQFAINPELGRRRKVQDLLEFRHRVNLTAPIENVGTFFRGDHWVTIEIGGSLLELREILHRLECS